MAKVHFMIGIQGSGKSTFSNKLKEEKNIIIISTDVVRKNNPTWPETAIWPEVYRLAAFNLKSGNDIIYDATNITPKVRNRFIENVLEHYDNVSSNNIPFEMIAYFFETDPNICFERVKRRNEIKGELYLPPEVVFSYHERLVKPSYDEHFSEIYIVKNNELIKVKK